MANSWELIFHFHWITKENPSIQLIDKGCISFWLGFDDFALDAPSIKKVLSQSIILYSFTSFHNKVVNRYFSSGFQIEAEGTDFFTQKFSSTDVLLTLYHLLLLYYALTHTSHFYM